MADHLTASDDASEARVPAPRPRRRRIRQASLAVVVLGVAAAGAFAWKEVKPVITARRYSSVDYVVPDAPKLTARTGETLFRIDPTRSSLTYEVQEELGGKPTSTAKGVTNGIAGDIALNRAALEESRLGEIVVNVEQFHSGNNLRDARLRQDFLRSHAFPLATFEVDDLPGLSGELVEGRTYEFQMDGFATVKGVTAEARWDVTASVADGRLTATAVTRAKLSRFDAGPISIAGLVSTSDDVTLTMEVTALDPSMHDIPTTIDGPERVEAASGDAPSFAETVQPILERSCASCHNTGQMGAHVLTLDTAGDAQDISDGIKTVTEAGYMPPWPASDKGVELAHEPTLSADELAALAAWSDAGGPLDVDRTTKLVPTEEALEQLPRRDQTLMAPKYLGSPTNQNDYRCFVLEPTLTEPMFLTGYTFVPDQIEQLHHAQVFHISEEQLASSAEVDGKDGRPGWQCYSGPDLDGRRPDRDPGEPRQRDAGFAGQANLVAGWVPGQAPVIFPERSGVLLEPGDALVLQIHYHFSGEAVPDRSGLALQLDPAEGSDLRELRVVNPLAPVEIPCSPEDQDQPLCDREAAMAANLETYGETIAANGLHLMCGTSPGDIAARFDGTIAHTSCDTVVPEDGTIISVMGHMHTIGKTFRLTLDPDTADEQILLDIPTWSFDWQMNYGLAKPLHVEAGQPVKIECSFDRSADPLRAPKYITFAEGTEDEMCFGTYSLIPDRQD